MKRRLCALELSGDEARIRQVANSEREIGAFGDQILIAVRHHQIDLEKRMPGEESRKQRHDAPGAVARRQCHPQHPGQTIGAARRAFRVVDREEGVARPSQQRLASVGGRDLPGGADQKLDRQSALERRHGARHGRLGQAEFAGRFGEASALDHPHEQRQLLQSIIHAPIEYIISPAEQYPSPFALPNSRRLKPSGAELGLAGGIMRSMTMGELSGKVAIVTGASKGIGAAIARRFAEAGAAVAVNYASDKAGAERVVDEIVGKGGKAVAIQANVSKSADVARLFAETKTKLGAPSILVNNAGVFSFAPIEAVTEEDIERQFGTNVLGTLLATKQAVAAFDGAGGSIINLSTIASVNPVPNSVVYSASKAAVDTITRALATELAPKNIRVNAIAPGTTETEGLKTMGLTMEAAKAMGMVMPMGRMGQPDDIARVALFLASDQSSWLTGERISASGGQR